MLPKTEKWHDFDCSRGYRQKRPPEYKPVLLRFYPNDAEGKPMGVAVGYLRYGAGQKDSPFFVTPQFGGQPFQWCDCLTQDLHAIWPYKFNKNPIIK